MKIELFPFQKIAVENLRTKADYALESFKNTHVPQVVSLQAPTGAGKTVMMTAIIESVLFGDERREEHSNAVFVWLSDSPTLNQQSKDKIDFQSDKIRFGQTVIVADESFDRETFEDGHIYFINTQKLSKAGNLGRKSDARQFTIWQTIQNTIKEKSDRLFFIIDEAHRGMQGNEGGKQTAIMQRFLKGWSAVGLDPVPVAIGTSATPARFNNLVESLSSTILREIVPTDDVRASGLLKDRIIMTYPENPEKQDAMAVLAAATREWMDKCEHWKFYCVNQHYKHVNPVFVIQVKAGTAENPISETDLDAALQKIAEVSEISFGEGQIVHTFGSVGDVTINGYTVRRVDPSEIAADRNIRIVFFKENLSTGWDCPRAETMMSFRSAEDHTYIAQLLGRMIRTPLQMHITIDESLNDVKLYLPYFNATTVDQVIDELRASECGEIPSYVGSDVLDNPTHVSWTTTTRIKRPVDDPYQLKLFTDLPQTKPSVIQGEDTEEEEETDVPARGEETTREPHPQAVPTPIIVTRVNPPAPTPGGEAAAPKEKLVQPTLQLEFDRKDIIRRINQMGITRYNVRTQKQHIHDYLTTLLSLASLLSQTRVYPEAGRVVREEIVAMMRDAIAAIRASGNYDKLEKEIREMRLQSKVFDAFGESMRNGAQAEFAFISDWDIDRQLNEADRKLGRAGLTNAYGREFAVDGDDGWKIDCIIFAKDEVCLTRLDAYAKEKFHALNDAYRRHIACLNDRVRNEYDNIVSSGDVVSKLNLILPETIDGFSAADGKLFGNHLYADEEGFAKIKLDSQWEYGIIEEESQGCDFVCWLRNPPRQKWSLCVPYEKANEMHGFYPDFMIVRRDMNPNSVSGYVIDVLEPHSDGFDDNLAKAKGLAKYAQDEYHLGRVQMIRQEASVGGVNRYRRLDFNRGSVREKVLKATTNDELRHIFETDGEYYEPPRVEPVEIDDIDKLIASFG